MTSQTESQFQSAVIETAQLLGWLVAHFRPAQTQTGWRLWLDALTTAGGECYVWKAEHFAEISKVLQAKWHPWELRPAWYPDTLWKPA